MREPGLPEPANPSMTGLHKQTFVAQFMRRLNQEFPATDHSPIAKYQCKRLKRALDLVVEGYSRKQALEILREEKKQLMKVE